MECKVLGTNPVLVEGLVKVESHGAWIFLKGEKEVLELQRKLQRVLVELKQFNPRRESPGGTGAEPHPEESGE